MIDNIDKKCPVCGGKELIEANYAVAPSGGSTGYFTGIPLGFISAVSTKRYICKSCGYLMEFFSKSDVEKLNKKYGNS